MEIQCECGKFRAELTKFPKNTPGRLRCYCDDCQSYLHYLKRADLLDANGGTEIIPVYPSDIRIVQGKEFLRCTRLSPRGMYRFSTTCCHTPIVNTAPGRPWAGTHRRAHTAKDARSLDQIFGHVRASIMGKFAHGTPPAGTPATFNFQGFLIVMPFILKGKILRKAQHSPFFDGETPIVPTHVLTKEERGKALADAGQAG
jgi:hypothetical protein